MMIFLDAIFKCLPQDWVDRDDDARDQKYIKISKEIFQHQTSCIIVILKLRLTLLSIVQVRSYQIF